MYIPRAYHTTKTPLPRTRSNDYLARTLSSAFTATHDPPSGMSTRTGAPPPTVAVARISGVRSRGRLVSRVPASRAFPSTAGPEYNPPSRAHAPSPCDSSPVGFLARTVRDVPAPPRVLPVSARSSRSESLCPGLSRFARSTACLRASRSPLARARLIAATAFFTRRCRHPIAQTVSAPVAPQRTGEKKMPRRRERRRGLNESRLETRKTEWEVFRDVEFDECDFTRITTRAATVYGRCVMRAGVVPSSTSHSTVTQVQNTSFSVEKDRSYATLLPASRLFV